MPQFSADILGRLNEATADELSAALSAIREDFQALQEQTPTHETAGTVIALRDAAKAIQGENTRRDTLAAEGGQALADLGAVFSDGDKPVEPEVTPEGATETSVDQPGAEVQEAANATRDNPPEPTDNTTDSLADKGDEKDQDDNTEGDAEGDNQEGQEGEAVTAGARPTGGTNIATGSPAASTEVVRYRTTASAGLQDVAPGAQLDRKGFLSAFAEKVRATSHYRTPGFERYVVATRRAEFPQSRSLTASADAPTNEAIVNEVVRAAQSRRAGENTPAGMTALTAAGLCAPLENLYDIPTIGDTGRPVRDALVRLGAERGGIQYRPALNGVTQTGGIGFWNEAADEADPLVPKTCVEIDCPGVVTAQVEAIYKCMTFSNMSTRFDPEFMASVADAQDIAHDRIAENRLLTTLTTASKAIYAPATAPEAQLGGARRILPVLDKMIAYMRNTQRLRDEAPLRWIAPLWALYLMRADMTMQMVGDGMQALAVTDEQILSWFRARNVNPTFHWDGIDPADITVPDPDIVVPAQFYTTLSANSPVPGFPAAISSLLFREGDWLHLDGGTLDVGVVRDSTLIGQNRFQTFSESFEFPAFRGLESIHLVIPATATGASAATADTTP